MTSASSRTPQLARTPCGFNSMLTYATLSDPGNRPYNEDSLDVAERGGTHLFILADGLGGHGKGEVASAIAVRESLDTFAKLPPDDALLPQCALAGQAALLDAQQADGDSSEMKTTLVLLRVTPEEGMAQWLHVGDSRLYRFAGSALAERTLDHSVPQMLVATGQIRERDIRFHEDRNRLVRVMGMEWNSPAYTLSDSTPLTPQARFLLCTDGFWEYILEKEMERCLFRADTPSDWLESMRKIVVKRGKHKNMDNYSAIAVFIS